MGNKDHDINARSASFLALRQIEREEAYANIALKQVLNQYKLPMIEARLAVQITYGTTRMYLALDHILSQFLKKPISELMIEQQIILRMSLYQLHYMRNEDYAVVNEAVKLTKKFANPKLAGLTNAVLRNYLRANKDRLLPSKEEDLDSYLHITLSFPKWLVGYMLNHFGPEETEAFFIHANTHKGLAVRTNTLKIDRDQLIESLQKIDIDAKIAGAAPESLLINGELGNLATQPLFNDGYFVIQGFSSQLVAHALSPKPGSKVLDLCAAPGGKTAHMATLMENKGEIHAFDLHPHKVSLIKDNADRLGLDIIHEEIADSRALPEKYHAWSDYILLDAPCSGLGVLAARADSRFRKDSSSITHLAKISYELLDAAADYLRAGGTLCYTTCTITHEENEANVERFLAYHHEFVRKPLTHLAPLLPEMANQLVTGSIQILPFEDNEDLEGFYIALLEKKNESA